MCLFVSYNVPKITEEFLDLLLREYLATPPRPEGNESEEDDDNISYTNVRRTRLQFAKMSVYFEAAKAILAWRSRREQNPVSLV
ncbi:hypothetical protein DIPPA_21333 [Diplonema papillatum]|nr:hypothetical protein DIPPA_18716 [Diplonema papillatum]KAJ9456439.1 hypothetical protein DIPPA_21333 [Diplonema papillatum]